MDGPVCDLVWGQVWIVHLPGWGLVYRVSPVPCGSRGEHKHKSVCRPEASTSGPLVRSIDVAVV